MAMGQFVLDDVDYFVRISHPNGKHEIVAITGETKGTAPEIHGYVVESTMGTKARRWSSFKSFIAAQPQRYEFSKYPNAWKENAGHQNIGK